MNGYKIIENEKDTYSLDRLGDPVGFHLGGDGKPKVGGVVCAGGVPIRLRPAFPLFQLVPVFRRGLFHLWEYRRVVGVLAICLHKAKRSLEKLGTCRGISGLGVCLVLSGLGAELL